MDFFDNWDTADKSYLMLSQRMVVFSVHTHRINKSIYTLSKTEENCNVYWDDGYDAKNTHAYTKR